MASKPSVTIVVPVYGDWPSLSECIDSLKKHVDTSQHSVLLVNDCGPEVNSIEQKIKQRIDSWPEFKYFRNDSNIGFVKTCNKSVYELDKTHNDILLLNSDTVVTERFLAEMQKALYNSSDIAAVSPRSNNATICTIPLESVRHGGINAKKSHKIFKDLKDKLPFFYDTPTVHGFCMLIRRDVIKKYGLFDEAFGKGYGEEVDFCMRIRKEDLKSVICNRAFVFHAGARSFTSATKTKLIQQNDKIIRERYPTYHEQVSDYLKSVINMEKPLISRSMNLHNAKTRIAKRIVRRFWLS